MKIQYTSDLHLEFPENQNNIYSLVKNDCESNVLVIAGDISNSDLIPFDFIKYCSENWEHVIITFGNHDFYNGDLSNTFENYPKFSNVHYLINESIQIENVRFFGTPLFSHIPPQNECAVLSALSDFQYINSCGIFEFNNYNEKAIKLLKDFIQSLTAQTVNIVVSHHSPSISLNGGYRIDQISCAFHNTKLDNVIGYSAIDFWIHGHSHEKICKSIGNTVCIRNPLGYVRHNENPNYVTNFVTV